METTIYDHYIATDWSAKVMAIARMTKKSNEIKAFEVPADIKYLQDYLQSLKGKVILTFEETTTSQWLYTELKDYVDRIIICDPARNRLLEEGPKTDKIDATKLVQLLRADLVKEVYHSCDKFLYLRRLVSGYEDLVKSGVRAKNQRYSLLRAYGLTGKEKLGIKLKDKEGSFVLECLERQIIAYEQDKEEYEEEFKMLTKKHKEIRDQASLPGIGEIGAVKIVSRVVSPYRFPTRGHYLSYVGLIKWDRLSGGIIYGRKKTRYCRSLKAVYKTAVETAIRGNNRINDYYEYLIKEKGYDEGKAKHRTCRYLAGLSLGVLKSGKRYKPYTEPYRRRNIEFKNQEAVLGL